MDLQDINYKPQTKHVDRRMFPSGSKKYEMSQMTHTKCLQAACTLYSHNDIVQLHNWSALTMMKEFLSS